MKKNFAILLLIFGSLNLFSQIPADSMYLGLTPPGNTPVLFDLAVSPGFFAGERIAISKDSNTIIYNELNGYDATSISRIKYYHYDTNKWNGPYVLTEGYGAPAFSITDDSIFVEKDFKPYYSINDGSDWSNPIEFLPNLNSAHYLWVTNNGNYYAMSRLNSTTGKGDWCKLVITETDTVPVSLGKPTNDYRSIWWDFYDFFVSSDETYMIGSDGKMWISYRKVDDTWTNPKYLDDIINFGMAMWGTYVSPDNKYLFYTTGTQNDYSDTHVYWVCIDGLVDSLKQTNYTPYVKNKISDITDSVEHSFSLTIPDSTFFDDDGNETLTLSAALSNGTNLPDSLTFNPETKTLSGKILIPGNYMIKITATDTAQAAVSTTFKIIILGNTTSLTNHNDDIEDVSLYPNPARDIVYIKYPGILKDTYYELVDFNGKKLIHGRLVDNSIDISGIGQGLYILRLSFDRGFVNKKIAIN